MKLGDVLKKERERIGLSAATMSGRLGVAEANYRRLEAGDGEMETWGPRLATLADELDTPIARLVSASGRAADYRAGQVGALVRQQRERQGKTKTAVARVLNVSQGEYERVEGGTSPLETISPVLLQFAEVIEQPVFNLFYPEGVPFQELDDYP